jgi:outer membrane lipoprotein SlyB
MNGSLKVFTTRTIVLASTLALVLAGCKAKQPATDDTSLSNQAQSRISSDSALAGQPIQASVKDGVATLNGSVTSEAARSLAANDVAQVAGIRTVVNDLSVQASAAPAPNTTAAVEPPPMPAPKNSKSSKHSAIVSRPKAPVLKDSPTPQPEPAPQQNWQQAQQQAPAPVVQQAPPPPPPPPAPVVHNVTLPAGASIPVRITQTLDSASTQTGDKFTGVVASDILQDGLVVLPAGTPVTGRVDEAKDAAHFKGSSLLTISLTSVSRHGERVDIATDPYSKQGEGRGKNTAEKVGGGAAVGAILGGIFGGGKGAAIGATAGGGVGAGANTVTRGQQVQIPSESVVRFKLANPIVVRVTTGGGSQDNGNGASGLEHR